MISALKSLQNCTGKRLILYCYSKKKMIQEEGLKVLDRSDRVSAGEFAQQLRRTDSSSSHVLIDVRPRLETAICRLPSPSINIPFDELDGERLANLCQSIRQQSQDFETVANRPFPGKRLLL